MRLHVMRHGPAEDRAPTGRDFDRALTVEGRGVVERAAAALRGVRADLPRVLASPFKRARETAEIVRAGVAAGATTGWPPIEVRDELRADGDVPLGLVRELVEAGVDALLVGHQPIVEELVLALLRADDPQTPGSGGRRPQGFALAGGFRTATIVTLEHAPDRPARWRLGPILDPRSALP